jgi:hypothetical protein
VLGGVDVLELSLHPTKTIPLSTVNSTTRAMFLFMQAKYQMARHRQAKSLGHLPARFENTKLQKPNTRETPSPNLQTCLKVALFGACLVFRVFGWATGPAQRASPYR